MFAEFRFKTLSKCIAAVLLAGGMASANAALVTISNGVYDVHISDNQSQDGSWNAVTGPAHDVGAGRDLTYDSTTVVTNFSSLRIFGAAGTTTYSWGGRGGATNLDPFYVSSGTSSFGSAGSSFQQTWNITPESLTLTQDLVIVGTTTANSGIYHSIALTNNGSASVSIGWRNLYDWAVNDPGFDDGPNNQVEHSNGSVIVPATTNEFAYSPASGSFVRVSVDPGVATYQPLLGLGFDPGLLASLPTTAPTEYDYVSWPVSFGTAFDYTTSGANVTGDSAGLSWFGRDAATALTIAPGATIRFTQTIFGTVPGGLPPGGTAPEPATLGLFGIALAGLGALRRRKK